MEREWKKRPKYEKWKWMRKMRLDEEEEEEEQEQEEDEESKLGRERESWWNKRRSKRGCAEGEFKKRKEMAN